jgi:pimeloyl-ACP methyl ester carboxylesterase
MGIRAGSDITETELEVVTATSHDGTEIACHRSGIGPPLVLVHGTSSTGARWTPLLPALTSRFTVYAMDRRGRGASGDTEPYAIEREYEDVAAVVDGIDEPVNLLGHSYGALCCLEATLMTSNVRRLVLYEPPFPTGPALYEPGSRERLEELLAAGDREGVLVTFMREIVRMPEEEVDLIRASAGWEARLAGAHTVPREFADGDYVFDPERFRDLRVPTMLLMGGESPEFLRRPTQLLERTLPGARLVVLEGQQHMAMNAAPDLFLRELIGFLDEPESSS